MTKKLIRKMVMVMAAAVIMLGIPSAVFAASSTITISADKTEAEPGDIINYTITLGPVSDFGTMQMQLVIPEGLSYVAGSGELSAGLKETLGFDYASFTEKSKVINGVASKADYSSSTDTVICTFQCVAEEGFKGTAEVGLTYLEFYSCQDWKDHTSEYSVKTTAIRIGGEDAPIDVPGDNTGDNTDPVTPGGNNDSVMPSDNTGENTDPAKPADDPAGNTDQTESADNTPENTTPADNTPDNTVPADNKPENNVPDKGNASEGSKTPAGDDRSNTADNSSVPADNGSKGQNKGSELPQPDAAETQSASPWLVIAAAVVVIAAVIILLAKRRKDKDE